jgi:hypothetical protein
MYFTGIWAAIDEVNIRPDFRFTFDLSTNNFMK